MEVIKAISDRWSCRAFQDKLIEKSMIETILKAASRAPSGKNHQPWRVAVVMSYEKKQAISDAIIATRHEGHAPNPDYHYYTETVTEPYKARQRACGIAMYQALGIKREDHARRVEVWENNYRFFGAPVALFVYLEKKLATGSWFDLGMFVQNILLAARGYGLECCPQASLAEYPDIIREQLSIDDSMAIACGISLGYADLAAAVNGYRTDREALDDFTTWFD